jgi:hypothetical protein
MDMSLAPFFTATRLVTLNIRGPIDERLLFKVFKATFGSINALDFKSRIGNLVVEEFGDDEDLDFAYADWPPPYHTLSPEAQVIFKDRLYRKLYPLFSVDCQPNFDLGCA